MTAHVGSRFIWTLAALPAATLLVSMLAPEFAPWVFDTFVAPAFIWMLGSAAVVVLAFFDWDALSRSGVARPFHWTWAFLTIANLNLIYVVGRVVVARRNGIGGTGPAWLSAALLLSTIILTIATVVLGVWAVLTQMSDY